MPPVLWAEVLTPTYCEDIGLPWAVVFSFKDRWRRMQVDRASRTLPRRGVDRA